MPLAKFAFLCDLIFCTCESNRIIFARICKCMCIEWGTEWKTVTLSFVFRMKLQAVRTQSHRWHPIIATRAVGREKKAVLAIQENRLIIQHCSTHAHTYSRTHTHSLRKHQVWFEFPMQINFNFSISTASSGSSSSHQTCRSSFPKNTIVVDAWK